METMLDEEQRSLERFLWAKGLNAEDIHKYMSHVYGGKCLSREVVRNWVEKFSLGRSKVADDDRPVWKWLSAGLDALVKRWDKCMNAGGEHVVK
jgi:hypothetical protein